MGMVIGVFSAKGGVGKTLLATNLAVSFALGHRLQTILVDLNPGTGTADLLLDLNPERSWADLREVISELTSQHIQLAVTPFRPGLDLLASPLQVSWNEKLTRTELTSLLNLLREQYELVLLDVPAGISDLALSCLELVDLTLILLTPDAPALRATSRYLTSLPRDVSPIELVINQQAPGAAVTPAEINNYLGKRLLGTLPIDPRGVWVNISYGEPCVLRKSSKLGNGIRMLSAQLLKTVHAKNSQGPNHGKDRSSRPGR